MSRGRVQLFFILTSRTDQLSKLETYAYDKNGNVTNFVDRRGISIALKYDALDRRTGVVYGTESSVRLLYDTVGRVTNVNDSIAGNIGLTYDSLDRLTQETNGNGIVSYLYNDLRLRTNMTVTGETAVGYLYDAANRLTNVMQGTLTSSLSYDDLGRRTNLTLPNGIKVLYRYDTASRLTNITYLAAVTNKIDYSYDDLGNRVAQVSAFAVYNLPSQITNSSYNAANQQVVFGSYSILYDASGNATNIVSGTTTNKLIWSARNQLTTMTGAVTAFFTYDGLGRRVARTVSAVQEKYLYDGLDVILQKDSANAIGARHFRGLAIDEPWLRSDIGAATTNRIYMADSLGSIVALTDTGKVIQTEYDYEPFGATTITGASNKNAYKFTAREDDGTDFYYYRARYYLPVLGRFVSEDPLEFMGGSANLYLYARNDPVDFIDLLGRLTALVTFCDSFTGHSLMYSDITGQGLYYDFRSEAGRIITPQVAATRYSGRMATIDFIDPAMIDEERVVMGFWNNFVYRRFSFFRDVCTTASRGSLNEGLLFDSLPNHYYVNQLERPNDLREDLLGLGYVNREIDTYIQPTPLNIK